MAQDIPVAKYGVKRIPSTPDTFSIGAFARAAGINIETIRFYQRKGCCWNPHARWVASRRYGGAEVAQAALLQQGGARGGSVSCPLIAALHAC
ncbi:MAG: MerR family transcriptional regulator [Rhodanobacter sp.]